MLKGLGMLGECVDQAHQALITHSEEDPAVMPLEEFVETDVQLTLDSGCCDHILDNADAPGYANALQPSAGSKRRQRFVVGNGERVPNRGQLKLRLKSKGDDGVRMSSINFPSCRDHATAHVCLQDM